MPIINLVYEAPQWEPWANTVAYYQFNWDINDHSGHWYNLTYWPTSYTTLSSWIKAAQFQWQYRWNWPNSLCSAIFTWWNLTISMWVNPQNLYYRVFYFEWSDNYRVGEIIIYSTYIEFWIWNGLPHWSGGTVYQLDYTTSNSTNTWYNIVLTYTSNTNTWQCYKNWSSLWTKTWYTYPTWYGGSVVSIWYTAYNYSSNSWTLSELIFENKTRTADEISNYYNDTKANYWL